MGQNYWVSGLCPSSGILTFLTFRKLNLFTSSGEGRETPTVLGPLERANDYYESSDSECYHRHNSLDSIFMGVLLLTNMRSYYVFGSAGSLFDIYSHTSVQSAIFLILAS
jgi:hypothetical protein